MARTSASDNSRASVTRLMPKLCARRTPSALVTLICVLPWTSRSGAICFAMRATPTSWTMRASAPAVAISASARAASSSSWLKTSVLKVMYPLTPRRCRVAIASGSSSSEKPTWARAEKCLSPKYTASAPASMAARSWGQYPAGLMTSGLRRGPMGTPSSVAHASTLRRVPTDPRETATAFRVLAAISFCHLLNDMMQSVIPAVYPILKDKYLLDFGQIGLITLTSQLTASLLQPLVGLYTDRRPTPYSLPVGMTFTMVGLILIASAPSFAMVLAAVALVAMGSAMFHPESSRVALMASGGRHGLAQSLFQVGGNAGSSLGPLLAAFIVLPAGQRSLAWFSGLALVAIMILLRVGAWYQRHPSMTPQSRAMRVTQSHLPRRQIAWAMAVLIALIFSKYFYLASLVSY